MSLYMFNGKRRQTRTTDAAEKLTPAVEHEARDGGTRRITLLLHISFETGTKTETKTDTQLKLHPKLKPNLQLKLKLKLEQKTETVEFVRITCMYSISKA